MALLNNIANAARGALSGVLTELTYQPKAGQSFTCKLAAPVSVGATSIGIYDIGNLTGVAIGDSVRISPFSASYKVTAAVSASAGTIGPIPVTPALTAAVTL